MGDGVSRTCDNKVRVRSEIDGRSKSPRKLVILHSLSRSDVTWSSRCVVNTVLHGNATHLLTYHEAMPCVAQSIRTNLVTQIQNDLLPSVVPRHVLLHTILTY